MVYNSGSGWGGVSGVPGLGMSIPTQARPGSSSANGGDAGSDEAWDNAGKSRLQVPPLDRLSCRKARQLSLAAVGISCRRAISIGRAKRPL